MTDELDNLTDNQRRMLHRHQFMKERRELTKAYRLMAIRVAAEYEEWLQENGRFDSFSTFINEFGYQKPDGSLMHEYVKRIRDAATYD